MAARRFNPLTYANKLKEVGLTEAQAEMIAQQQEELVINADTHLATKEDLLVIKEDLKQLKEDIKLLATKAELVSLEQKLTLMFKADLVALEQRLTLKLGSMLVIAVGLIETITKIMGR